jgi:hypothetical protein
MEVCAELGFNLDNVEGVAEIKPKALGMKGQEVDFDALEIGERPSELRIKGEKRDKEFNRGKAGFNRVDLGKVADESKTRVLISEDATPAGMDGDFVPLDFGGGAMDGRQFEELNYNHKLRRKLHRAIEAAQVQKELLVRAKAKEFCKAKGIEMPPELAVEYKPIRLAGRRILEDGTLETEKQERVRKRLELAEYNKAAKVLRQQAKAEAIEAGLRVFAELTGKTAIDVNEAPPKVEENKQPINITLGFVERDDKPKILVSKKRQREDETSHIKKIKKSKKSQASVLTPSVEIGEVQVSAKTAKKQDPSDLNTLPISDVTPLVTSIPNEEKLKKDRKRKKTHDLEEEADSSKPVVHGDAAGKEKKRPRKEKRLQKAEDKDMLVIAPDASTKKLKKSKRHTTVPIDASIINEEELGMPSIMADGIGQKGLNIKDGDQWNPDALNGDVARKDKFLRLLGGSKVNGNCRGEPIKTVKAQLELTGLVRMENELERQFEAGIRIKHDGQRKKGLGA